MLNKDWMKMITLKFNVAISVRHNVKTPALILKGFEAHFYYLFMVSVRVTVISGYDFVYIGTY